jgi:ATP-dependent RNA helicase DDX46/PRP5
VRGTPHNKSSSRSNSSSKQRQQHRPPQQQQPVAMAPGMVTAPHAGVTAQAIAARLAMQVAASKAGANGANGTAGAAAMAAGAAASTAGSASTSTAAAATAADGTEVRKQYVTEVEINDYPQQARWKVTRKDALEDIVEWTRCAVTVRGNHYPPGKVPADGDRKLYISIEGDKRDMVKQARKEVRRRVEEAAIKSAPEKSSSRYSVI